MAGQSENLNAQSLHDLVFKNRLSKVENRNGIANESFAAKTTTGRSGRLIVHGTTLRLIFVPHIPWLKTIMRR